MKLKQIADLPPWDWPPNASDTFKRFLRDHAALESDRILAAELAGDLVAMDNEIAALLEGIVTASTEPVALRASAAIALGPVLEQTDIDGFDEPNLDDPPITEETFDHVKQTLHNVYSDVEAPKEVRRRALEASVRALQGWTPDAIRNAWTSGDPEWKLTAVFGMQYTPGFEREILAALESSDPDLHYQAVRTAGQRGTKAAWPHVKGLLDSPGTEKNLLLTAMSAAAWINPEEAGPALVDLAESDDSEIAEAAREAMLEAENFKNPFYGDVDDDEEEDDNPLPGGGYIN